MANTILPVKIILPEEEARKLAPSSAEITVTMCDKCYALVPIWLIITHTKEIHNGR